MKDKQTHDYFDEFTPHFKPERFHFAIDYLNKIATNEQNLIDIGCGDGATLHLIKTNTPLQSIVGLDVSANYLSKANKLVGCDTIQGSILDKITIENNLEKFDYCTMGAVLHHLIGKNRKESFYNMKQCLENAIKLLKPGGSLIIFEPTFSPSIVMDIIFWIKKFTGKISSKRIKILKHWANIGQPVVSYYTPKQLIAYVEKIPGIQILEKKIVDSKRLGLIISNVRMGIIINKSI